MSASFEGGCHCKAVRYRVDLLASERTLIDCNCSICTMKGFKHLIVPLARFHLLKGGKNLSCYRFNTKVARHVFCQTCGVTSFYYPRSHPNHCSVNANCLDNRSFATSLACKPFDGQNWEAHITEIAPPEEKKKEKEESLSCGLIDIGVNLLDPMFQGRYRGKQAHPSDFDLVLQRAKDSGVRRMIITAGTLSEARKAVELVANHDDLYCTVGVHPTRAKEFERPGYSRQLLELVMSQNKVVAVGECGLDYDRTKFCPKKYQLEHFTRHLEITHATGLPLFLHNRNCGMDLVNLLAINRKLWKEGVVHSFTGSAEVLKAFLDMGLYIGINGCSLKTQENIEVMKTIPLNRLMLETDAPWCSIRPTHAGFSFVKTKWKAQKKERFTPGALNTVKSRCEPCHMRQVLEVVAGARGLTVEEVTERVWDNTMKVFFPAEQRKVEKEDEEKKE